MSPTIGQAVGSGKKGGILVRNPISGKVTEEFQSSDRGPVLIGGGGGRSRKKLSPNELERLSYDEQARLQRERQERERRAAEEKANLQAQQAQQRQRVEKIEQGRLSGQLSKEQAVLLKGSLIKEEAAAQGRGLSRLEVERFLGGGTEAARYRRLAQTKGGKQFLNEAEAQGDDLFFGESLDEKPAQTLQSQVRQSTIGGMARQPTAREELLQMSIAEPRTTAGKLVRGLQTRETFIEGERDQAFLRQKREFESMGEDQLISLSGSEGSGITGMSTEQGSVFSLSFDEGKATRQGELAFANLPGRERGRLLAGSAAAATGKLALSVADFTLDVPLTLATGGTYKKDASGKLVSQRVRGKDVLNKFEPLREVRNLPSGGATTGFIIAGGAGLLTQAGTSFFRTTRGFTVAERIGEAALLASPLRPSPKIYGVQETQFVGKITDIGIEGQASRQLFVGRGATAPTSDINVASYQVIPKGSAVGESVTMISRPVSQFRGGLLKQGRETVFLTGRATPTGFTPAKMIVDQSTSPLYNLKPIATYQFQQGVKTGSLDVPIAKLLQFPGRKPTLQRLSPDLTITGGTAGETILTRLQQPYYINTQITTETGVFGGGAGKSPFQTTVSGSLERIRIAPVSSEPTDLGYTIFRKTGLRSRGMRTLQEQQLSFPSSSDTLKNIQTSVQATSTLFRQSQTISRGSSSIFAGTGLYERSESPSGLLRVSGRQSSSKINLFSSTNTFERLSDKSDSRSKNRLLLINLPASETRSRQRQRPALIIGQASSLVPSQSQRTDQLLITTPGRPGGLITPRPTRVIPPRPPRRPPIIPSLFGLSDRPAKKSKVKRARREIGLNPSFTAINLGIRGKTKFKAGSELLGLDIRPLEAEKKKRKRTKRKKK